VATTCCHTGASRDLAQWRFWPACCWGGPTSPPWIGISGISVLDNSATLANAGVAYVVLKDWSERDDLLTLYTRISASLDAIDARVITLPCNLGIGGAMQTGFRIARDEQYDVAVQVDGDGQHPVVQIDLLVNDVLQTGSDIVIGSRFLTGAGYQSTASRRLGIRIFSVWLSAICHTRITDATSGFRAFNARAIALLARSYAEDYPEVEAIVVAHRAALSIHEVPVRMAARSDGVSSIGGLRSIGYMFKVSLAILMCSIRRPEIAP